MVSNVTVLMATLDKGVKKISMSVLTTHAEMEEAAM